MSEAVKAAIRAARQQQRANASSPTKGDDASHGFPALGRRDGTASPFARNDFLADDADQRISGLSAATDDMGFVQTSIEGLLNRACQNGRLNLSSRSPALTKLPQLLFTLCDDDAPSWFSASGLQWWERQDLRTLIAANGELEELDERLALFRALTTLDLHNNRLPSYPDSLFQLKNLTSVTISHNKLTSWPQALLALDNLISLDISHNKLESLWSDEAVEEARRQREQWDTQQQEDEHQGIWAGLGRDTAKEKKEKEAAAAALAARWPQNVPLRALKVLNLASNRLSNAALGFTGTSTKAVSWPPLLQDLDLSDNAILSPVVLHNGPNTLAQLTQLNSLILAGNGISDEVFREADADESATAGGFAGFANLTVLDLRRCEIDDMAKTESFFGSSSAQASSEETAVPRRELIRISDRSQIPSQEGVSGLPRLGLLLEGNPLREETFKQRRGGRSQAPASTQSITAPGQHNTSSHALNPAATPSAPAHKPAHKLEAWEVEAEAGLLTEGQRRMARIQAARKAEADAAASGSALPDACANRPPPVKTGENKTGLSDWDGEPVLPKYLQRRQQAFRGTSDPNSAFLEYDEHGAPGGPELSDPRSMLEASNSSQNVGSGSTLSNAQLSDKKKQALGQVPCKFYRSNGCSAGAACPFAHTMPGDGHQKAICAYWAKGQCKFGHKCALLHILPGQPVSMDRKNKRAAQQAQNSGTQQDMPGVGARLDSRGHQRQNSKNVPLPQSSQHPFNPSIQLQPWPLQQGPHVPIPPPASLLPIESLPPEFLQDFPGPGPGLPPAPWFAGVPPQAAAALLASLQNGSGAQPNPRPPLAGLPNPESEAVTGMDLAFGLPDDLQNPALISSRSQIPFISQHHATSSLQLPAHDVPQAQYPQPPTHLSASRAHPSALADPNFAQHFNSSQADSVRGTSSVAVPSGSSPLAAARPVSVPYSRAIEDSRTNSLSGSPAFETRAFGTSPFSHPAGTSVFFSTSHDDPESRSRAAFLKHQQDNAAHSMSRIDDVEARERWASASRDADISFRANNGHDDSGEGFVPSSLTELLTPAELERRMRSTSQTTSQRPLSFVGYPTLNSQTGHRQGQLSSSSSRFGNPESLSHSPNSSNRWPSGSGLGASSGLRPSSSGLTSADISSSLQAAAHSRNQLTPTRSSGLGRTTTGNLATPVLHGNGASGLLSSSSSGSHLHETSHSLPQSLATGLGWAHRHSTGPEYAEDISSQWPSGKAAGGPSGGPAATPWSSHGSHLGNLGGSKPGEGLDSSHSNGGLYAAMRASERDSLRNSRLGSAYLGDPNRSFDELGPVAPSSVLPHRPSPLSMRHDNGAPLPTSASGSFVSNMTAGSGAADSAGAQSADAGSRSLAPSDALASSGQPGWGGIAIPGGLGGASRSASSVHRAGNGFVPGHNMMSGASPSQLSNLLAQHHAHQQGQGQAARNRNQATGGGGLGSGANNSPMVFPAQTKEEYDEAIFELE
ncbi:hypothetical protein OC845_002141 [Tilletia horrida]|nr:hypothetical protein OC845_002141 [Tilletia horrida]